MLNKYPYNNGHLLVAPYTHLSELDALSAATLHELSEEVRDTIRRVRDVMNPDGLNVGMNLGRVAGAGFEGHLHFHVVPRWNGDTNFMTAVSGIRVISQHLEATRKALEPAFKTRRRGPKAELTGGAK
jgi:ATP adenylyltransferase